MEMKMPAIMTHHDATPSVLMLSVSRILAVLLIAGDPRGLGFTPARAASVVPVFIFGDSLADVGNNNYLPFSVLKSNFVPYGVDYGPTRTPTGRFSNGRLVLDIMGERLGFPAADPYLSPRGKDVKTVMEQGVNYASAGCGILDETTMNSSGCISLSAQVKNHIKTVTSLVSELGLDQTQSLLSSSVYFLAIGNNDFIGNYFKKNSPDAKAYSPSQFITLLANSLTAQIVKLYGQSARKFVIIGLGPLGCIPSQRTKGACNANLSNMVVDFNAALEEVVKAMGSQFSNMKITFANPHPVIEDFLNNPSNYGFSDTSTACCGGGPTNSPCLPFFPYCPQRDNHMFWDIWHPSQAVNTRVADSLLATNTNLVAPYSIIELFQT